MKRLVGPAQTGLAPEQLRTVANLIAPRSLELIVLPTEQCNFRCTYCYEDFELGRMPGELVDGVKHLLTARAEELTSLHLSWFGGEPLLARDVVLDISTHAMTLAAANPGLHYVSSVTTNGYLLTPTLIAALAAVGVTRYQVTLDGPRTRHDRTRVRADGKQTFERIWSNLEAIADTVIPIEVLLRLHFDASSVDDLEVLIAELRSTLLRDPRFTVLVHPIQRLGGLRDQEIPLLSFERETAAVERLSAEIQERLGSHTVATAPTVCHASLPTSLVIRSDGRVAKCTVALMDRRNDVGQLRPDGTIEIDQARLAPWLRGLTDLDLDVLACPLKSLPRLGQDPEATAAQVTGPS